MKKTLLIVLAALLLFTGCKKEEKTDEEQKVSLEEKYANEWTIEMTISDVTPVGLKGKLTHTGDRVHTILGDMYTLEIFAYGEWTAVDMLCEPYWYLTAYSIPDNGSYEFEVNWEWLYGTLPQGHYRIGKNVEVRGARFNEYQGIKRIEHFIEDKIYYAEFDI